MNEQKQDRISLSDFLLFLWQIHIILERIQVCRICSNGERLSAEMNEIWEDKKMMYLLLIVGFFFLVKGADVFVDGSSSVAKNLRVPTILIGLTVVAFGTSCPEAAVSITASVQEQNGISLGNVIGSNIFNLMVVAGLSAIMQPMKMDAALLNRDFPLSILAAAVLLFLAADRVLSGTGQNMLSRVDGLILLGIFVIFLLLMIRAAMRSRQEDGEEEEYPIMSMGRSLLYIAVGLAGIVVGGKIVVDSATDIALAWGMSETLVGLTIVSIGTSLPELVTSVVAAAKKESDIALGNVVGSNIFNILLILGAASAISPLHVEMESLIDTFVLILMSLAVFLPALRFRKLEKREGIAMVAAYAVYLAYIILR